MKYTLLPLTAMITASLYGCGGGPSASSSSAASSVPAASSVAPVSSTPVASSSAAPTSSSVMPASSSAAEPTSSSMAPASSSSIASSVSAGTTLTIEENTTGYCGTSGTGIVDTKHAGFEGAGFVDAENIKGSTITWKVNASESAEYNFTVRYALASGNRSGTLVANGNNGVMANFSLPVTGTWTSWQTETKTLALNAGSNSLVLTADGADGVANIDSITIAGPSVTAEVCATTSSSSAPASSSASTASSSAPPIQGTGTDQPKISANQWVGFGTEPTGGQGGQTVTVTTGTALHQAMCNRASKTTPLTIMVNGTINHGNTAMAAGSCDTAADKIQLKGVENLSIIGVGDKAIFDQIGLTINKSNNIIIRNLHIKNVKKSGSPLSNGGDSIAIEGGSQTRIWIDHNTLEASGGESLGYDSLLDMKQGTTNVTISYNHWLNSSRGGLIGANDDPDNNDNFVFHHNFYENISQRTPLLRRARIHTFNNYWENNNGSDQIHYINARAEGSALVENNYFKNVANPIIASTDSDVPGCWAAFGNAWEGGTYTRTTSNGGAHKVPVNWQSGDLNGNNCSVSGVSGVQLDVAGDVPAIVKKNAGHGKI